MSRCRAGLALRQDEGFERRLAQDLARQPKPRQRHPAVLGIGEVVRVDQRHGRRCRRWRGARVPRDRRPQIGRVHRDAGVLEPARLRPRCRSRGRDETGYRAIARRSPPRSPYQKPPVSNSVEADRAAAEQQILQPGPERAMRPGIAVIGMVAGAFGDGIEIEMILKIFSRRRADRARRAGRPISGDPPGRCPRASAAAASRSRRR